DSAVTPESTDILLESANFNGPSVRQTARALGLRTEASARFERALPPELALAGARRAAALISELAGGAVHREWADVYPHPQEPVRIRLKPWLVDEVLGLHVPLEESEGILIKLGFHVRILGDGEWDVLPPVFRLDVSIPEDLVEEVGTEVKVYGGASVFLARVGDKTTQQPEEPMRLGVVADAGATAESGRQAFYAMKSVLDGCLRELGSPSCTYQRAATELFHPGRCAAVFLDARQLGYLGELHPSVVSGAGLDGRLVAMEVDLEPVLAAADVKRAESLPRYPVIERDLAVVVEDHLAAAALLATINE